MSTRSSPTSSRSERNAAGTPKSTTAGIPRSASARTSLRRLSWVCWSTPGIDATGSGASIPSFTKSGATRLSTSTRVSPTSRRNAGVRRSRRDRCSANATNAPLSPSEARARAPAVGQAAASAARVPPDSRRPTSNGGLRSRLMVVRFGLLLSCVTLVVAQAQPAFAATPSQAPPPPQRILLVGDSTAETIYPFLRDAAAARGVEVQSAARIGCGVIDGSPKLDDGRPYIDYFGDTSQCAGISSSMQGPLLARQRPDTVVWLSGWESWPNRELDGQLVHFGTIAGNKAIRAHIDTAVARLTASGARLVMLPVAPNAYPSARGLQNVEGDSRLAELARLLRTYARHADKVSLIDLPTILQCPTSTTCPADVGAGIRPRDLDGFHFDGDGAVWLADQLMGMLLGNSPPPTPPAPPTCAPASLGNGLTAARNAKCA